jgi:hypothetical protein
MPACELNGDGFPDIYFLNMMGANHYSENRVGKGFVEKTAPYFPAHPGARWGLSSSISITAGGRI